MHPYQCGPPTVCIIPEDCSTALDSYRTPGNLVVEDNVRGVIAQGIDVLFRTEPIHEINAISRCRGNRSSCGHCKLMEIEGIGEHNMEALRESYVTQRSQRLTDQTKHGQ